MICALCNKEKVLRKSHILPEFLYAGMYENPGRRFSVIAVDGKRDKYTQKGFREPLLCDDCEAHFQKYEVYAAPVYRSVLEQLKKHTRKTITLENIDYARMKLFILSIVWRCGIASGEFFKHADLDDCEMIRLRELLVNNTPGETFYYPPFLFGVTSDDKEVFHAMAQPFVNELGGIKFFVLPAAGFVWLVGLGTLTSTLDHFVPAVCAGSMELTIYPRLLRDVGLWQQSGDLLVNAGKLT